MFFINALEVHCDTRVFLLLESARSGLGYWLIGLFFTVKAKTEGLECMLSHVCSFMCDH